MQVKIEKKFQVKEPAELVWRLLSDPTRVVASVPGAKLTEKIDDYNYKGSISIKVGPTVTDYKGEVRILNLDNAAHRIELEGKGSDSKGRGSATMKMSGELVSLAAGGTEVVTTSEVSIVGLLAQFGGRMINDVSNKIFQEFTKSFQRQLEDEAAAQTELQSAGDAQRGGSEAGFTTDRSGTSENELEGKSTGADVGISTETVSSSSPGQSSAVQDDKPKSTGVSHRASAIPASRTPSEPEPIKALPLIFSALWDGVKRFFRGLLGRSGN